jgi:hypothetical protein
MIIRDWNSHPQKMFFNENKQLLFTLTNVVLLITMNNCKFILAYNIKTGSIIDDLQIEKTGVAMIVSFATENKMDTPIRLEKG